MRIFKQKFNLSLRALPKVTLWASALSRRRNLSIIEGIPLPAGRQVHVGRDDSKKITKPIASALAVILVLSGLVFSISSIFESPQTAQAAWYNNSWNYRQKIIIDHNKVPNTDQTDFPVLIKITDANNALFSKAKDDGSDIRFTSSNQTTDLSFEVETFSKTTKELWAWVKIPTLSHDTDTTIYLYYGNASAIALDAASRQAVWSNGYAGVWHLNEASGNAVDSVLGLSLPPYGNVTHAVTGKSGLASSFAGGYFGDKTYQNGLLSGQANMSVTAWARGAGGRVIQQRGSSNAGQWGFLSGANSYIFNHDGSYGFDTTSSQAVNTAQFNQVGFVANGLNGYFVNNGQLLSTTSASHLVNYQTTPSMCIGGDCRDNNSYYSGVIDEVRVSRVNRSADWIATEYANQNSPETFATIAGEVSQVTAPLQASPSGWYDMAWGSRQPIVFQGSKVPNTNQTDFPALVKITDVSNDIWAKAQADGDDVLFTDTNGNKLAHEIEKYDPATHELWAWVKVPTLTTSTNTTIYMYYGNASAPSQQNKTAVWSNGYAGVWHMGDGDSTASNFYQDSTSNNFDGTLTDADGDTIQADGKIAKSIAFNGDADGILTGMTTALGDFTACAWYRDPGTSIYQYERIIDKSYDLGFWIGRQISVSDSFGGGVKDTAAPLYGRFVTLSDVSWHYICSIRSSTTHTISGDGGAVSTTGTVTANATDTTPVRIGRDSIGTGFSNATIDDIHISTVARSADWIATEYANQNDPSTFETFGAAETADTFAPSNPSTVSGWLSEGGSAITNNSGTDSTPYYSWPEPEVAGGATDATGAYVSGVAGYYSYFGTSCGSGGADPAMTRGVLSDTGSGLHYSSDLNVSVPDLTTNTGSYCLRLKTKDNAGNISAAFEAATYNFDLTAPNAPTFIAANPAGYSSTDSFDFTWPVATDNTNGSGIAGYQYKRGNGTDDWSATQVATSKTGILSYQTGENIFLVRSVDNAGNTSAEVQTTYYYSNSVPVKPTAVIPTPAVDDVNSFAFSWTAPVHVRPIVDYGYSINAIPTAGNLTWTGNASTSLSASPFATAQGDNTFYLVAKDDSGAYGVAASNYATATFNCTTVAPPIPTGVSITDSSNRTIDLWALTIKWSAGAGQGASFDHYSIERSVDNISYTEIATTESLAYIDSNGLNNTTLYYYRVKAIDNANSPSASSTIVSKTPTGKYTTPPTIVTEPSVSVKASSANISWTVDRASTSAVRFGTQESDMARVQINSTEETSHSVNLAGLTPATTYYYQLQSLDNFRDYTSDSAFSVTYSLTTLPAPSIQDLTVSNITIRSAEITFETSSASATTINYGATTAYGSILENTSATTLHTTKLTSLEAGTSYHLKITGTDIDGNSLVSDDYVFDTLPMPKISDLTVQPDYLGPNPGIKINWKTNVETSSSVEYIPKQGNILEEKSKSALVADHEIILQGLTDSTSYRFYIYGTDQFGNTVRSDENSLDTPLDSRPPKITELNIESQSIGSNQDAKAQIVVSWKTDEPSTSQVEYGQGVSGETYSSKTQKDASLIVSHTVIIGNLDPSKTYHLKAVSADKANNLTSSEDNAVITKKASESAFNIIISALSKAFGWLKIFR